MLSSRDVEHNTLGRKKANLHDGGIKKRERSAEHEMRRISSLFFTTHRIARNGTKAHLWGEYTSRGREIQVFHPVHFHGQTGLYLKIV